NTGEEKLLLALCFCGPVSPGSRRAGESPAATRSNFYLEKRGRTALPVFSFFFGNIFHVVHVGARLGQYMVQVIADTDEGESFFQELAHASGAEEEESENEIVLAGVIDQLLSGRPEFRRGVHVGEFVL